MRMGGLSGADYHRLRAAAELKRAVEAADPKAAALHRELAELHRLSAGEGEDMAHTSLSLAPVDGLAEEPASGGSP